MSKLRKILIQYLPESLVIEIQEHTGISLEQIRLNFLRCMADLAITAAIWHRWNKRTTRYGIKYLVELSNTRYWDMFHSRFAGILPGNIAWATLHIRDLGNADHVYYMHMRSKHNWYPDDGPWHTENGGAAAFFTSSYLTHDEVKERLTKLGLPWTQDMIKNLPTRQKIRSDEFLQELEDYPGDLTRSTTPEPETESKGCTGRTYTPPLPCRNQGNENCYCDYCLAVMMALDTPLVSDDEYYSEEET